MIIDLRKPEEYRMLNIPGSINLPYGNFLDKDPAALLTNGKTYNIFYSNGDLESNYALAIARGLNLEIHICHEGRIE